VAVTRAADVAGGDVLILSDANNHYVADTLRALVAPFADPEVGVVAGRKVIDDGQARP
jgi:cellulose synthase/poly-beta-1,6-N-acetylglucosamine synthase-like glycosyltransferase